MRLVTVIDAKTWYPTDNLYGTLISLIHGINLNIGRHIITRVTNALTRVKSEKKYVDSGGYSIIVGDVHPRDFRLFIQYYVHFLDTADPNLYDYLFSLDIPVLLKYPNTKITQLYEYNKLSLSETFNVLNVKPDLKKKLIFIWQFKVENVYEMWSQLVDDFSVYEHFDKFGVGGMVGIRRLTGISFTPFIGPFFRILYDCRRYNVQPKLIHFLGISNYTDRIVGSILQHILNKVLNYDTIISYDTFAVITRGMIKQRMPREILEMYDKGRRWTREELAEVVRANIDYWVKEDKEISRTTESLTEVITDVTKPIEFRVRECILRLSPLKLSNNHIKELETSLKMLTFAWNKYCETDDLQVFNEKVMKPFIRLIGLPNLPN